MHLGMQFSQIIHWQRPIKRIGIVLSLLFLLTPPARAAEYQGKNIDGRSFAAEVYSYETGGVYQAEVQFKQDQAAITFAGGGQLTIKLRQPNISDVSQIEGYGEPGRIYLGNVLSIGLESDRATNQPVLSGRLSFGNSWRIRLDPAAFSQG